MVASDNLRGGTEGIVLAQHRIGGRDGEFTDRIRVHHIAKIDYADQRFTSDSGGTHQDIVIIGIVVNNTLTQGRQHGQNMGLELLHAESLGVHDPSALACCRGHKAAQVYGV